MAGNAMHNLTYGLYVLTARDGDRHNGCIIDTAVQVASSPAKLSISVNKNNLTHDMILKTGEFNVSVINVRATLKLFERFGFQSGRTTDKFAGYNEYVAGENGLYYITEGTNSYISVKVFKTEDLGSHTMFIGEITDMKVLNDITSMTYKYYLDNIKPKPKAVGVTDEGQTVWRCTVCGYEYVGEELPENFICPLCKQPA